MVASKLGRSERVAVPIPDIQFFPECLAAATRATRRLVVGLSARGATGR
ncbi:MAG TPA: hypothetical protein VF342_04370 [Alphaproteobacteria bacterium]